MSFVTRLFQASSFAGISAVIASGNVLFHDWSTWQVTVPAILIGIAAVIKSEGN